MHILLTDILCCPRCGPEFGLVLMADRMGERVVREGRLGCANCRELFPIRDGTARLRPREGRPLPRSEADRPSDVEEEAVRIAALLGLAEGGGAVLIVGAGADLADAVQRTAPEVTVVHLVGEVERDGRPAVAEALECGFRLPFFDRKVRGAAVLGMPDEALLDEALRVTSTFGRVLVEHPDGQGWAGRAGAELVAADDRSVLVRHAGGAER